MPLPYLPLAIDLESRHVLKAVTAARAALAELKGASDSIPNGTILIDTLGLQEALESSEIENIVTTQDDLYRSDALTGQFASPPAKEVHNYVAALRAGFDMVRDSGLLTNGHILAIQAMIEENTAGFRRLPGTTLKNDRTGEVIYTPPQDEASILGLMGNLETFINDDALSEWDPLIKMAIVHHQFESIHPFYDGNGRTGRIINILYLVRQGLLDLPVLYLSRYINHNKAEYYRLLQAVRTDGAWEDWVLYIVEGVRQTALQTVGLVRGIGTMMSATKQRLREDQPKIYSQDLLNNLFRHPYTKIEFVERELGVHRNTAYRYLEVLSGMGLVDKYKVGKDNYYLNTALVGLLMRGGTPAGR